MIQGIILAAGFSSRMKGRNKLLVEINGKTIVEHVIESCLKSNLDNLILVYKDLKIKEICDKYNIKPVYNNISRYGMSTSLIAGINSLENDTDAVMFLLGDMPFVSKDVINELIGRYLRNEGSIVAPLYEGKRGNPVLFDKKYFDEIWQLTGDEGAKSVILNNIEDVAYIDIEDSVQNADVDCEEDLKKLN